MYSFMVRITFTEVLRVFGLVGYKFERNTVEAYGHSCSQASTAAMVEQSKSDPLGIRKGVFKEEIYMREGKEWILSWVSYW